MRQLKVSLHISNNNTKVLIGQDDHNCIRIESITLEISFGCQPSPRTSSSVMVP